MPADGTQVDASAQRADIQDGRFPPAMTIDVVLAEEDVLCGK